MDAIRVTFFQECEEGLADLERGLLAIEAGDDDTETLHAVFRAVHSIKGGAGAFGLETLVRFSHAFESTLDEVRTGRLACRGPAVHALLRAADVLGDEVRAARDGELASKERAATVVAELKALHAAAQVEDAQVDDDLDGFVFAPLAADFIEPQAIENVWRVRFEPRAGLYAKANEAGLLLRELARLGSVHVELDASALPRLDALDPEGAYLAWTIRLTTFADEAVVREVFEFVEDDCALEIARADVVSDTDAITDSDPDQADVQTLIARAAAYAAQEVPPASTQAASVPPATTAEVLASIRVDLARVDRLIDLVGELVINQAVLAQRVGEAGLSRSSEVTTTLSDLEQLTREIQDSVMAIRAQPVRSVFQRMPRLAREVAASTGKEVRLLMEGEGVEVDKTVIERLADPLTHMIRNAIDHGLELAAERVVAGKRGEGTVRLAAGHRSGRLVIEVSDDGRGIDRARIRAIAVARGLIAAEDVLTDEELDNLIFMPGFSTATAVSDISGRGVGMDVVRRSVAMLGGRISIASRPGLGSTFTLSLPLTLAVLDGMVVTVGDQTLVVPLTVVVETLQPAATDVKTLGDAARLISIRGGFTPLVDVAQALGYRAAALDATAGVALLIEAEGGARAALLVDAIQGQRQVVIKSLEANYRAVEGVAAATILGDGRVALILDVDALVVRARSDESALRPRPLMTAG